MVIGNGLIGAALVQYEECARREYSLDVSSYIFFASGVSYSGETSSEAFLRETLLLDETIAMHPDKILVYFSSLSIFDTHQMSPYKLHKLNMEELVHTKAQQYRIIRLPNIVGSGGNKYTCVNYFRDKIISREPLILWEGAQRMFFGIDDVIRIVLMLLTANVGSHQEINIVHYVSYTPLEIVSTIAATLDIPFEYVVQPSAQTVFPPLSAEVDQVLQQVGITKDPGYLARTVARYCMV